MMLMSLSSDRASQSVIYNCDLTAHIVKAKFLLSLESLMELPVVFSSTLLLFLSFFFLYVRPDKATRKEVIFDTLRAGNFNFILMNKTENKFWSKIIE